MKKILFFLTIIFSVISCTTNYYTVLLTEDTSLYLGTNNENIITTIPKNTQVYVSNKANKKKYRKIKWGSYSGWAYNPIFTYYNTYVPTNNYKSSIPSYNYTPSSNSRGTVPVKGYTRKDGTYVRPHTRSAPRRR